MKIGYIWQIAIGNYIDFIDLGSNHITSLDVISEKRKIIMEIKNRYNTDNSSARQTNIRKLENYKLDHPDYTCIYAVINDKTHPRQIKPINNSVMYYSGDCLLNYVFGSDKDKIVRFLTCTINTYLLD